jgi:hypothetical protein
VRVLLELEDLVAADAGDRVDALSGGSEDDLVGRIENGELPEVVRDREVVGRDVCARAGVVGLDVDPPVAADRVVADVVGEVLGDRDDGALAQVRPDGIVGQGEDIDLLGTDVRTRFEVTRISS